MRGIAAASAVTVLLFATVASAAIVPHRGLGITFQGNRAVTNLLTTRPAERTARNVGVGSTEAEVKARVAGVRCRTELGFRHCFVGRFLPGRRIKDFRVKRGRVTSVDVGIVTD